MLSNLRIHNLRNITSLQLQLDERFTIVTGENGSGKTSLLEAIYLLSCGHSFRAREISALVKYGSQSLTLYGETVDNETISLQKNIDGVTLARLNGNPCLTSSELALFLPSVILYQDIFDFISNGPAARREVLDWGMFHVEHSYLAIWKQYKKILKQRNSLLKQKPAAQLLIPWNQQLAVVSEQLHTLRKPYFVRLEQAFQQILPLLTDLKIDLHYYQGWDRKQEGKSLEEVLQSSYGRDLLSMYTHYGAHQADISFIDKHHKVKTFLSRGQQKICLFALKFAQVSLIKENCIFLIDDISAELDDKHLKKIMAYLHSIEGQFVISCRGIEELEKLMIAENYSFITLDNGEVVS